MRWATLQSLRCAIDRVTTQHTPKCVENCSDNKVSIIVLLTPTRFFVNSVITLKTAFLLNVD